MAQTAKWYVDQFLTMHETLKTTMAFDTDTTFEFAGIIPIRSGHNWVSSYRAGVYKDSTNVPYYQSFKDLQFNGPRVAQYWLGNNPEQVDIWNVCTIQEGWATLPDGTDGVADYYESAYRDGIVDYPTQIKQPASWYKPTTPAAVHDNIHYNQIGYNELGRESARNALILLGEIPAPVVMPTVKFVAWDGFTPVNQIEASTTGASGTLVVPMVTPVWKSKDITYTVTDGLRYEYYDLMTETVRGEGKLSAVGTAGMITVAPRELTAFRWNLSDSGLANDKDNDYTENAIAQLAGSVTNHVFSSVRYKTEKAVQLLHNEAWCVEIQIENWLSTSGNMLLSSSPSAAEGAPYFYFRPKDFFVGIGCYNGSTYDNYGISLKQYDIACSEGTHTYRFLNRISDDGTNVIYLFVDDQEIGALTDHYVNSTLTDSGNNWLSGKDFAMSYFGTTTAPISNCTIRYITVTETNYNPDQHLHDWSAWEMITLPSPNGSGEKRRTCSGCGEVQSQKVDGVWQTHGLSEHMSPLPDVLCGGTNLWALLPHDAEYYHSGEKWAKHESGLVYSVTISANGGDKLFATSFGKYPGNGNTIGTSSGIRVTFFNATGVLKTLAPQETYAEFSANGGYIVAPEGTVAVNIPMYGDDDTHALYILNRDHVYENGTCTGCGSSVLDGNYTHAIPENQGVQNAIDRAYSLTDVEWTPLADVPGVKKINGEYTVVPFEAGVTYRGIPYSGTTSTDTYVGLNVTLESFLTALENKNSVLYTENLFSTNPKSASYFGTVCSKFAQYVLDVPGSYNTNNVANIPGMETIALPGAYTVDQIKLGDVILDVVYHTAVCTDILYDEAGNVAYIEISEAVMPLVRRKYWTVEEFYEHFDSYRLCRYAYIDQTPALPETSLAESYALMPRFGDKYNYKVSSTKGVVDVLEEGYARAVILRDGQLVQTIELKGATSFKFDRSIPGHLEMYLEKADGTRSGSVYAQVVSSSLTVTDSSCFLGGKLTVSYQGSSGVPLYVQLGSGQNMFCELDPDQADGATITFRTGQFSGESRVRVAFQNEYGIYLSAWTTFTVDYGAGTGPNPSSDPLISQATFWEGHNITPSNHLPVIQENKPGYWSYTMIPVAENTTYYSLGATRLWYLDSSGNPISTFNAYKEGAVPFQFTTPQGAAYVNIAYSPNFLSPGQEQMSHPHNWQEGICTECGEADPDYHIPGDINGDGDVNNKDLTRLFKHLSGYEVEVVEAALDVNGDGSVNNKDLTRLFRYLSGYEVEIH